MTETSGPILKSFRILGLHGYKDIEVDFQGPARIVIAENGSGKTTILSALAAFLDGAFEQLTRISFEAIECQLADHSEPLVLRKAMLPQSTDPQLQEQLASLARFGDVDSRTMRQLVLDSAYIAVADFQQSPVFHNVYLTSPMSWEEVADKVIDLREKLVQAQSEELKALTLAVQGSVGKLEVLYLPTYRRVELPLARSERPSSPAFRLAQERRTLRSRTDSAERSRWEQIGIQFGLADVENRLADLLNEIQRRSNIGYRVISANIIDELLAARIARGRPSEQNLPDIDALKRFFSRIETGSSRHATESDAGPDRRTKALQELYSSGEISSSDNDYLRYFLTKLSRVVDQTREVEANIEQFVAKANDYLLQSSDEKRIQYDASRMKVLVRNLWTGEEVKLDDLSSGEKQVVSLLAHLYLYDSRKIVLVDEPELSLSIDWQRRLLPDVLGSPTCVQLLAITHSPFIFDNELDPYAGPLSIRRRKP